MSSFDDAFDLLMGNEGQFVDNPADPGGATMWGVTERVARAYGYQWAMKDLSRDTAKAIAKQYYWDPLHLDDIHSRVAFQVFDANYNGGHAAQWLQAAVGVNQDGIIGKDTIAAVNNVDPLKVVLRFDAYRIRYLVAIPAWPTFGKGWMSRIAGNLIDATL